MSIINYSLQSCEW